MKRVMLILLIGASGCHLDDWQTQAINDSKELVREQINKDDFALNWHTQCVELGYSAG